MLNDFKDEFGDIAPIGYILRNSTTNCIRIHNFTNKQYPENTNDKEQIINLYQNLVDMFCHNSSLTTYISFYDFDIKELDNIWLDTLNLNFLGKSNINSENDEPYFIKTYSCLVSKKSNDFKQMILDVADEEFDGNITFYCKYNNHTILISPYPGGVDIFTKNNNIMDDIKQQLIVRNIHILKCP